ncbi:MAG: hypothetical protein KJ548_13375 [Actinobacteria bacterium]|nr:hypothetical protein [Actinomycetota bacterium]MCG2800059.1 hypothetical protein [Cellulomonas sp.]
MNRRTRARILRPAGAGLAVLVLAACTATNPVTTNEPYSLSDGVRVTLGPVTAVNLLVVSAGEGEPGVLSGALTNDGADDLRVTLTTAGETTGSTVDVAGGGTVYIGTGSDVGETVQVASVDAAPGQLLTLTLTSPAAGSTQVQVPVLDGTLPQYASLVPTPTPSR